MRAAVCLPCYVQRKLDLLSFVIPSPVRSPQPLFCEQKTFLGRYAHGFSRPADSSPSGFPGCEVTEAITRPRMDHSGSGLPGSPCTLPVMFNVSEWINSLN